ncbi:MAG: hypothetical protein GX138_02205 [Firmicutes bacterium]|nr:hypothetical protein [Bacillota bacterium]
MPIGLKNSQLMEILDKNQVLSLIGFCKNAGKTTVLNAFLQAAREEKKDLVLGLLSIGLDGESLDRAGTKAKPRILVTAGTLFISQTALWSQSEVTKELVDILGPGGALGSYLLIRARSAGYIQLSGPSSRRQTERVIQALQAHGAERVIIDGSINRRVMDWQKEQTLLLATAPFCFQREEDALAETLFLYDLLANLPLRIDLDSAAHAAFVKGQEIIREFSLEQIYQNDLPWNLFHEQLCDGFYFQGAITNAFLTELNQNTKFDQGFSLIIPNGSKIMLDSKQWTFWQERGLRVYAFNNFTVGGIFVNQQDQYGLISPERQFFKELCFQAKCAVFDIKEGLACNIPV